MDNNITVALVIVWSVCFLAWIITDTIKTRKEIKRNMDSIRNDIKIMIDRNARTMDMIELLRVAVGEDLKDIGKLTLKTSFNVELISSMNLANYVANANETIKHLINDDKFEEAEMLKKNLEKLISDFKRMNPDIGFEIKDVSDLNGFGRHKY